MGFRISGVSGAILGFYFGIQAAFAQGVDGPTFDCARVQSFLGQAICGNPAARQADWALSTAYWARYFSLDGTERLRLRDEHVAWLKAVEEECGRPGAATGPAGACVARQYRARAQSYREGLSGDALAEASLRPATLIALQSSLIDLGFMSGRADGLFGAGTRQAIRTYKQTLGQPPADFLTAQERAALLRRQPVETADAPAPPPGPPPGPPPMARAPMPPMPMDPRAGLPGMLMGILGQAAGGAPLPPPPQGRWAPGAPPPRGRPAEFDERPTFEDRSRPGRAPSVAAGPDPLESEFSDGESAQVTRPLGGQARPAAEAAVRTVEIKGTGENAEAARRDATRLAIQEVAGVFIDTRRRIELNVSEAKVSEVVNEKLISYTNAYVSKVEVVRTEQKDGLVEVVARVAVSVAPLLKVLRDNAVPTVSFDTATAAGTVEALSQEKAGAMELYADLVARADTLVRVGVGTPQVDPTLPSSADEAWLRIPITYSLNEEALRDWRTRFDLFAQQREQVLIRLGEERASQGNCSFPAYDLNFVRWTGGRMSFISTRPPAQQHGVAACFAAYETPNGVMAECLGRNFVTDDQRGDRCEPDKPCLHFPRSAAQVRLVIELLDGDKDVIFATRDPFRNYPSIALGSSRREPLNQEKGFFNYCVAPQSPFFAFGSRYTGLPYGDVLVFPPKGSRIRGYYNIRLPNSVISRIGSVRARIAKDAS